MKTIRTPVLPVFLSLMAGVSYTPLASAQIVTDGSMGATVTLNGLDVEINESLGTRAGSNLFHSFETFNIQSDGSATFTGASNISNVISRVTGGDVSSIQGTLRSTVGSADVYFVNPAGVTVGEGGSVDVPGAFHLSTADELTFTDGTALSMSDSSSNVLTMASPEAFGFLDGATGSIEVRDNAEIALGDNSLNIESSNLFISNGTISSTGDIKVVANNQLSLEDGGRIASDTEAETNAGNITVSAGELLIDGVEATDETGIITSANASGNAGSVVVDVEGSATVQNGGFIQSSTLGAATGDSGSVQVTASGLVTVQNLAGIASNTFSEGDAGEVVVSAAELLIDGQESGAAAISSSTFVGPGKGGAVEVTVDGLATIQNGGLISSVTLSFGGDSGEVNLTASELFIDGQGIASGITSSSLGLASNGGAVAVTVDGMATIQNGGMISSDTAGLGAAGTVDVSVGGLATILNGSFISSGTLGFGDAGEVSVSAGELLIDGQEMGMSAITTSALGDFGNAGTIDVTVDGLATILNGGLISSVTNSIGNAGEITVSTGELLIDGQESDSVTGVSSSSLSEAIGNAGTVAVTVDGLVTIQNGGKITSDTSSFGVGGNVTVNAGELLLDRQGNQLATRISSNSFGATAGDAGTVAVNVDGLVTIQNGAEISSTTSSSEGDAGEISFTAGELLIDGQDDEFAQIASDAIEGSGNAGIVDVTVDGLVTLRNGGIISSITASDGDAGEVSVRASELFIDGQEAVLGAGISSASFSRATGNGGSTEVTIDGLTTVQNGGYIANDTSSPGSAGNVIVNTGELLIDHQGNEFSRTRISSDTSGALAGVAGTVEVNVDGLATILNGGSISSVSFAGGDAGQVSVKAGELLLDSREADFANISSDTFGGSGNAGTVDVTVEGLATFLNGGAISSSTGNFAEGDAGEVRLSANEILIDGQGEVTPGVLSSSVLFSTGNAGTIEVTVEGLATIRNGGAITSDTETTGAAGNVLLNAGELLVDGQEAEIATVTSSTLGSGNAGMVEVNVGGLITILNGGFLSAVTLSEGDAGEVRVRAGELFIDGQELAVAGITSDSLGTATGNAGTLEVTVDGLTTIQNGGFITSFSAFEGAAGTVVLNGDTIVLGDESVVSSAAIAGTSASGSVEINAQTLILDDGFISTRSVGGAAGSISINANALSSRSSEIVTTTSSDIADGGDVTVNSEVFVLQETIIQANAVSGSGGEIIINTQTVVPESNQLNTQLARRLILTGDDADVDLPSLGNVIQAVAPTGVTVPPVINAPEVDISGALSALDPALGEQAKIADNPCSGFQQGTASSLIESGRSGLPAASVELTEDWRFKDAMQNTDSEVYFVELDSQVSGNYIAHANGDSAAGCRGLKDRT